MREEGSSPLGERIHSRGRGEGEGQERLYWSIKSVSKNEVGERRREGGNCLIEAVAKTDVKEGRRERELTLELKYPPKVR